MNKIQILLVENRENEIEFFTDALKESGLAFLCNTARNVEQAFKILKNTVPDAVFVDARIVLTEQRTTFQKMKSLQKAPLIFYSSVDNQLVQKSQAAFNYVQLPGNIQTMAKILKNLFIDNTAQIQN